MIAMEKKNHTGKISSRLPARLSAEIRAWAGLIGDDYRYTGRRMGLEDLVAWVLLDFMSKSDADRRAILERAGPELERMRAGGGAPGAIGSAGRGQSADDGTAAGFRGLGGVDVTPKRRVKPKRQ